MYSCHIIKEDVAYNSVLSVSANARACVFLLLLTRCEEVLVVLRLVQRMVRMRRQYWGWHERVSILQNGHAGGQRVAERRRDHLSQRLGFVQ